MVQEKAKNLTSKEALRELETIWAEEKPFWSKWLQEGKTPVEMVQFLRSFA